MKIKNLGPIKDGEIEFNDLVVIWGDNNSGKTMLTYLLYAIKEEFKSFKFELSKLSKKTHDYHNYINKGSKIFISNDEILDLYKNFQNYFEREASVLLAKYFAVDVEYFKDFKIKFSDHEIFDAMPMKRKISRGFTRIIGDGKTIENTFLFKKIKEGVEFHLEKQEIDGELLEFDNSSLTDKMIKKVFTRETFDAYLSGFFKHMTNSASNIYFPAERVGINQFREELKLSRASKTPELDEIEFSYQNNKSAPYRSYPLPVEDYIKYIFSISSIKYRQPIRKNVRKRKNLQDILEGEFIYNKDINDYEYLSENCERHIPFKIMSSSLKSMFGLSEYLNRLHPMVSGGSITIDEPEMNLHPSKQVKLIEELTELISNSNINMVLSTHSSFIARKLINIVLKNDSSVINGRVFKNENLNIYETIDGGLRKINLLKDHSYIDNFDVTSLKLDEEYFSLLGD